MTVNPIITALKKYGLKEREAKIYVFLLQRIESSVFEIAQETQIPRATVYKSLEEMKSKGYVTSFKKNEVLYYTPENPNTFLTQLKNKVELIETIIPQIRELTAQSSEKPSVKLYVGEEGIKIVLEDILETLKNHSIKRLYATSHPDLLEHFPRYFPKWLERRKKLGVYTQLIMPGEFEKGAPTEYTSNEARETRFLPPNFPFECSLDIYGNKIAFFSFKDNQVYSVIVESLTIADLFRQFFLFSWNMLDKTNFKKWFAKTCLSGYARGACLI